MKKSVLSASLVIAVTLATAMPAQALCMYHGKNFQKSDDKDSAGRLNAKTTVAGEFKDAMTALRGRIVSSREIPAPKRKPDADAGVLYRLRVDKVFKGEAVREASYYTERNSGGLYLDQGKDYFLFLNPPMHGDPALDAGFGALILNYACGQSKAWDTVSAAESKALDALAARRK